MLGGLVAVHVDVATNLNRFAAGMMALMGQEKLFLLAPLLLKLWKWS